MYYYLLKNISTKKIVASICIVIGLTACSSTKEKKILSTAPEVIQASLDSVGNLQHRQNLSTLISIADCISPKGKYVTEMHTDTNGYVYFKQLYSYQPDSFVAVIPRPEKRFQPGDSVEGIPAETVYALRGHAFHNLILELDRRFFDMSTPEVVGTDAAKRYRIQAKDEQKNTGWLLFDVSSGLLHATHFSNPYNKTDTIKTTFSDWRPVNSVRLPYHIGIEQGGKKYSFDFRTVSFNDPAFQYKKP